MQGVRKEVLIDAALREPDAFSRPDETDDAAFYGRDRMVNHLGATALGTVTDWIGRLVIEEHPRILDLMASWDSHLPADLDDAYGKELVAETRVMGQWMKTGGRRNETWDGWVMAEVCRALLAPEHFAIDWKNNPPFWAKPFKLSPNEDGDVKESAVQGFFSRLAKLNS